MPYLVRVVFLSLFSALSTDIAISQQRLGPYIAYGPETKFFSSLNYGVYQSKNGYLWFGTSSGLVRFDGKRYKNFYANYTSENSPSDNIIFDITADKNDDIWLAGFRHGVSRYNQRTGTFKKFPALSKDGNPYYGTHRVFSDSDGDLWVGTAGRGLAKYDFEEESFRLFYPHPDKPRDGTARGYNYVTDIEQDPFDKKILWTSTFFGLFSFDKTTETFTYHPSTLKKEKGRETLINDMEFDRSGKLWLGTYGDGMFCFDTRTKQIIPFAYQPFSNLVYNLKLINDSIMYAACLYNGLHQLNILSGKSENITPPYSPADPTARRPDIQRVSVTRDAGVFIGGNYYFYQRHDDYLRLEKNVSFSNIYDENTNIAISGIIWDSSRQLYWVTSYEGSGVYTLNETFDQLTPMVGTAKDKLIYTDPAIDGKNQVWVLKEGKELQVWNETKKKFGKPTNLPFSDSILQRIWRITGSEDGSLWMMSGENFVYWNSSTGKLNIIPIVWDPRYTSFRNISLGQLRIDPDGNAWLFTQSGIFHCLLDQHKVNHIFESGATKSDRPSAIASAAAFDKHNAVWMTSGSGIQIIDRKTYSLLSHHDIEGGLPAMLVNGIAIDQKGRVWAGTSGGLGLFNPKNKTWRTFNRMDGLQKDYLDGELFVTSNNKLVIDQHNGFLIKDADEIVPGTAPPVAHITSIRVNGEEYASKQLPEYVTELSLPYNRNSIDIEFAAMDWLYPSRTFYYTRIDGISRGQGMANEHQEGKISLVDLRPGSYKVHILAISGNGVYAKEIILPILIRPPFWKTWWFILLLVIVVGTILYGLYRYRVNRIIELQNLRNDISRDLHDDIGASLSNINILNELTKRNLGNEERSKEYLSRASDDIQRISESLSDIVWNINPKYDELENLFIRMKRYVADMLDGKNINGELDFPEHVGKLSLSMTRRRDFYLVFKEAVNNLVKYSGAKNAIIKVWVKDQHLLLLVKDDGKGFDMNNVRSGNGLQNMQQRARAADANLTIESQPGKGTSIQMDMKIN